MLCLIVMFLARTLQHLLIKVNLSGFRALHMDQGCSHLLADCLRLQRDIHGIKRCQGTPSSMQLLVISQSLDHQMFWAARFWGT